MAKSKLATLVPLKHLDLIKDDDYFMALSHVASNSDYVDFFKARSKEGKHVILDNSCIEIGEPEKFEDYFEKALAMRASEIMFPDIFEDPLVTLMKAWSCAIDFAGEIRSRGLRVMVIPQGKSRSIWLKNTTDLRMLMKNYEIEPTIGITYRYTKMFGGSRYFAVTLLSTYPGIKVHLLGAYADPRKEAQPLLMSPIVRGLDSSYPSVYAKHGIELTPKMFGEPRPERNIDFLEDEYDANLLKRNIEVWRDVCEPNA